MRNPSAQVGFHKGTIQFEGLTTAVRVFACLLLDCAQRCVQGTAASKIEQFNSRGGML